MNNLSQFSTIIADNHNDYDKLLPLYYKFEYNNIPFDCQIVRNKNQHSYVMNLKANIGHLPYSSEDKQLREEILNSFSHLMEHRLIIIDHHCSMTFPIKTIINGNLNAKKIVESILYTLLDVKDILTIIGKTALVPDQNEKKYSV